VRAVIFFAEIKNPATRAFAAFTRVGALWTEEKRRKFYLSIGKYYLFEKEIKCS
jgi:hypothetical protein